jgi:hypothetical protein
MDAMHVERNVGDLGDDGRDLRIFRPAEWLWIVQGRSYITKLDSGEKGKDVPGLN